MYNKVVTKRLTKSRFQSDVKVIFKKISQKKLGKNKIILKSQQRFQNKILLKVKYNKIALSNNENRRKQRLEWQNIFAYGTNNEKSKIMNIVVIK